MAQFTTLRSEVKNWNLGSDDKFFKSLQQFSDNMFQKTQTTLDKFQEIRYLLNSCNIEISNTFSQYQKLSERKFTEQKMAPIGDNLNNQDEKKDTQDRTNSETKQIEFFKQALSFGMDAFNIGGNDDQGDDLPDERSISQSSVSYSVSSVTSGLMKNQRLPHLIGSKFFMTDKYIGLFDDDDDIEEAVEELPQGNIISQDVYDPNVDGNQLNQSQANGVIVNNGAPPAPPLNMNGVPPAPPMNMNGVPPAPPINMNGVPPAPPMNMNGVPPAPPMNMNGVPPAPPINVIVNNNAPPAPPLNFPPPSIVVNNSAPPPPPLNIPAPPNFQIPSERNQSVFQDPSSQVNEGSLQDQLLRALQQKANTQTQQRDDRTQSIAAKPRPTNFLDEIKMRANKQNQDEILLEKEDVPVPPPKMSMRDNLMRSLIGDSEPNNNEGDMNRSSSKVPNAQEAVAISAIFKKSNNLFIDSEEEDNNKLFNPRGKSKRFEKFGFENLLKIERPKVDDDEEEEQKVNNKSNAASIVQQSSDTKKVQFNQPPTQSLVPPPPPPPIQIPIKQEVPKKRLEKLFESSDDEDKDPFGKALKIGQQYRNQEKQATTQPPPARASNANAKKKLFDDSDSDVDNFKSNKPAQAQQNAPPVRSTTQSKALKIFNDESEEEDNKPAIQPAKANPLAPSKPKEEITQPAKTNPLGGRAMSIKKKKGLMDSSDNSNSEDDSSKVAAVNAATKAKEAEKQRLEAEQKLKEEQEQIRLKEEQQKKLKEQQEEQLKQLKLKQEEEDRKHQEQLKVKEEQERLERERKQEEERIKREKEENEKKNAVQQQVAPAALVRGVRGGKKKSNKFGSSSENEDSEEEDHVEVKKQSTPPPPAIIPTTSILSNTEQSSQNVPPPALNPMEEALKESGKKASSFENTGSQSLNNRVSQALKERIEAMGNLDPTRMLKGMPAKPKIVEEPKVEEGEEQKQSDTSQFQSQNIGNSLLISTQMDRISIPMKKKKPRTLQTFVDQSDLQVPQENFTNNLKASIILPDDEDEKPLAVQKRNLQIKEKDTIKPPSNLPNITSNPNKKTLDLGASDDDIKPIMAKQTQPPPRQSNPLPPPPPQTQQKPKGGLDLGDSDDDDKPIMTRKSKPTQPNPPSALLSSQNEPNPLIKGLPNISGVPTSQQQPKSKPLNLTTGNSDDEKPLTLSKPNSTQRQAQSLMPSGNSKPKEEEDNDLGIKPIGRSSENPLKQQGGSGLPNISSNPLAKPTNLSNNRPSGLPNISENPLTKSSNLTNSKKTTNTQKKRVMFGDSDEEEEDKKDIKPLIKPSIGGNKNAVKITEEEDQQQQQQKPPVTQNKPKKNLFADSDNEDKADDIPKPPPRPSVNQTGGAKKRNLFGSSDEDDNKNDEKPALSRPTLPSIPSNDAVNPKVSVSKPIAPAPSKSIGSKKNLFNDSDEEDSIPKPPQRNTANPLGGSIKPAVTNPLGGGRQATGTNKKKNLFGSDSD